jgi:uncharacterized protein with NAD-binding domain and iron-sulfur cluster
MDIRIDALKRLEENAEVFNRPDVRKAVFVLLDQANRDVYQALQDSDGQTGIGEAFGFYEAALLDTATKAVDWKNPQQLCVLAKGSYNTGSAFSTELARKGGALLLRCVLEMARGVVYDQPSRPGVRTSYRSTAIPLLVDIAALATGLSPEQREQIREAVRDGLTDTDAGIRMVTVEELGKVGTAEWLPALEEIAQSDPFSRPVDPSLSQGRDRRYDVREYAKTAIDAIQGRAKAR